MPDQFTPQTIEMALSVISSQISRSTATEIKGIGEAAGRILAVDVISPKDVPEHPLSAMDGFAFSLVNLNKKRGNSPLELRVTGRSLAGHPLQGQAQADSCVRIFTGARVPPEFDAVIPQERVTIDDAANTVRFSIEGIQTFANVRKAGEDIATGAVALAAGTRIGAREIALLASIGVTQVHVMRKIRVAVLSTGDEVIAPGAALPEGKTYDANRPMLLELVRDCGFEAIDLGIVGDDAESLRSNIQRAASIADAVITSGGVSVGEADHTRNVMQSLGEIVFWKLAIKPGRPLAAGWLKHPTLDQRVPFFGLPGNPVAAFVTFQAIVGPCLQQLAGARPTAPTMIRARLSKDTRKAAGRTEFLRCMLTRNASGEWLAEVATSQGAASLKSLVDADGLVVLPHEAGPLTAGTAVDVIVLR